jgi:hypothetical protein
MAQTQDLDIDVIKKELQLMVERGGATYLGFTFAPDATEEGVLRDLYAYFKAIESGEGFTELFHVK